MMKKTVPASGPDAYAAGLSSWQRIVIEQLRAAVHTEVNRAHGAIAEFFVDEFLDGGVVDAGGTYPRLAEAG